MLALRVLVADTPEYFPILERMLCEAGHETCGLVSAGDAVSQAVRDSRPDVVLMDAALIKDVSDEEGAWEILRLVSVPVVVMVSAAESAAVIEGIAGNGALGFIKKPVSMDELRVYLRIAGYHTKAIRKLSESELLHRSLFNSAAVGIYTCHKDGRFLACNQAYARMLGYANPAELLRLVRSADEQIYAGAERRAELLAALAREGAVRDAESQVYGRDGDLLWVAEYLAPIPGSGEFSYYEGVVMNISAKKRAEAERNMAHSLVRTTMDAIADFVAATDLEGNIIIANKAFTRELSLFVGKDRVLRLDGEPGTALALFKQDAGQADSCVLEVRGLSRIGGYGEDLDTSVSRFYTPEGEVVGAVFVMRPVRKRRTRAAD